MRDHRRRAVGGIKEDVDMTIAKEGEMSDLRITVRQQNEQFEGNRQELEVILMGARAECSMAVHLNAIHRGDKEEDT